jgi:hypothetical protein
VTGKYAAVLYFAATEHQPGRNRYAQPRSKKCGVLQFE